MPTYPGLGTSVVTLDMPPSRSVPASVNSAGLTPQQWSMLVWNIDQQNARKAAEGHPAFNPKPLVPTPFVSPTLPPVRLSGGGMTANPRRASSNIYGQLSQRAAALAGQPVQSGTTVTQTPRSAAQNQFLAGLQNTYQNTAPARNQFLTNFVRESLASQPSSKAALDQESAAVESTYNPAGLEARLAEIRRRRAASVRAAAGSAMARAGRDNNLARMQAGNNSYLDRAYANTLAEIATQQAMRDADYEAEDERYLQGQRMGALGARERLLQNYLLSLGIPYESINRMIRSDAGTVGDLAQLENANSLYDVVTPEDDLMRRVRMAELAEQLENRQYA